ncbi:MAG: hypothetical protein AAGJ93_06000 [Bacteroidota bacterium]
MSDYWINICVLVCFLLLGACTPHHRPVFLQKSAVQLSSPLVQVDSVFFYQQATIRVGPVQEGCQVYYVDSTTHADLLHPTPDKSLLAHQSSSLQFTTKGDGFQPSETVSINVFKIKPVQVRINSTNEAKAPYDKSPLRVLVDQQKAGKSFRHAGWLGFQETQIELELECKDVSLLELVLSCLEDQGSWIFAPTTIQASFYDADDQLLSVQKENYLADVQQEGHAFRFLRVPAPEQKISRISLIITNLKTIPDWHPGSGHQPWLFIDEIILL